MPSGAAWAQDNSRGEEATALTEIVVTARRKEESLQEVPVSVVVMDQAKIDRQNITGAVDLAAKVPSLAANTLSGTFATGFTLRGFPESAGLPSVGFYFADVVAIRGGNSSLGVGDGAGPGSFFDLENIQVLRGPQGTLFGRNTTGGAVLAVPKRPSDKLEGYVDASFGNYAMRRFQGVVNVPISATMRARFGAEYNEREGYQKNIATSDATPTGAPIGPRRLGSQESLALRGSLVWDVTSKIENYTIARYLRSDAISDVAQLFRCNPAVPSLCPAQQAAGGGRLFKDYYDVAADLNDQYARVREWQVINRTTAGLTNTINLVNILSYGQRKAELSSAYIGTQFRISGLPVHLFTAEALPGVPTGHQNALVEEARLEGNSFNGKLDWQGGFYYERSKPNGLSGFGGPNFAYCTPGGNDPFKGLNCQTLAPGGTFSSTLLKLSFRNVAVFGQGTYKLTEQLNVTAGIRYTWDRLESYDQQFIYGFPTNAFGPPTSTTCFKPSANAACESFLTQRSKAPTWLLGLDYSPNMDLMLYAKYSRGYRQGGVAIQGPEGANTFGPEKVDSYEAGAKWTLTGPVRGVVNFAVFTNNLTNQQLPIVFIDPTFTKFYASIQNVGKTRISGAELDTTIAITPDLQVFGGYTFLDTKVKKITPVTLAGYFQSTSINEGDELTLSPHHKFNVGVSYRLPIDESLGDLKIGATYFYTGKQFASADVMLPSYETVDANLDWTNVFREPVDFSLFVTNLTGEKYAIFNQGLYNNLGYDFRRPGLPRMYGARLRYHF